VLGVEQQLLAERLAVQIGPQPAVQPDDAGDLRAAARQELLGNRDAVVVGDDDGVSHIEVGPQRLDRVRSAVDRVGMVDRLGRGAEPGQVEGDQPVAAPQPLEDGHRVERRRRVAVQEGDRRPGALVVHREPDPVDLERRRLVRPVLECRHLWTVPTTWRPTERYIRRDPSRTERAVGLGR
jgi:hypothetical protein